MTTINKQTILKYIDTHNKSKSLEELRSKLSLLMGYYAGMNMDCILDEDVSYTSAFNVQWKEYEDIMVQLNEVRPIDFELSKSVAAGVFTARGRLTKGGLTNLFLNSTQLSVLDFANTTSKVLGEPVPVEEVTLFFTALDLS